MRHTRHFAVWLSGWLLWSCQPSPVAPAAPAPALSPASATTAALAPVPVGAPTPSVADFDRSPAKRPFPATLSSDLPYDIDDRRVKFLDTQGDIRAAQREFDIFSWQAFLALNWPVTASGHPLDSLSDSTSPRMWSTWRTAASIFLPDGAKPQPWTGLPEMEPTLFRSKAAWRQHPTSANENFQAFTGPLVDQNGKWVRYEVLVNSEEFAYLTDADNVLYNLEGQVAFSQRTEKPNEVSFPPDDPGRKIHGATEIKLAWKELDPKKDDKSRFFVARVKISPAEPLKPGQTELPPREVDAGLVGMHIAVRTRSSPEWIWATFEQVDDTRVNHDAKGHPVRPNFFDPAHPNLPVNVLPPKNAILDPNTGAPKPAGGQTPTTWIESLTTTPTQVKRIDLPTQGSLNPLDADLAKDAAELNAEVQARLQAMGSVFQYYELVDTQWPVHPNAPAFAGGAGTAPESITHKVPGDVIPVFVVNTTMETYFMKGLQPAGGLEQDDRLASTAPTIDDTPVTGTESCVGCHYSSGICLGFKKNTDGTDARDPVTKQKIPIFGEDSHFGKTGNANFSWLLQIEGRSTTDPVPQDPRNPSRFLDIGPAVRARARLRQNAAAPEPQRPTK